MVRPDIHPSVHTLQRLLGRVGYAPGHTRPCYPAPDTCRYRGFMGRLWKCMSRMGTVHCHLTLEYTNRDPSEAWLSPETSTRDFISFGEGARSSHKSHVFPVWQHLPGRHQHKILVTAMGPVLNSHIQIDLKFIPSYPKCWFSVIN